MQIKAGPLGEDGLPGEEESFEKGETAESYIKVRAVSAAAGAVTLTGLTADFVAAKVGLDALDIPQPYIFKLATRDFFKQAHTFYARHFPALHAVAREKPRNMQGQLS